MDFSFKWLCLTLCFYVNRSVTSSPVLQWNGSLSRKFHMLSLALPGWAMMTYAAFLPRLAGVPLLPAVIILSFLTSVTWFNFLLTFLHSWSFVQEITVKIVVPGLLFYSSLLLMWSCCRSSGWLPTTWEVLMCGPWTWMTLVDRSVQRGRIPLSTISEFLWVNTAAELAQKPISVHWDAFESRV